jgi:hypothetical protein
MPVDTETQKHDISAMKNVTSLLVYAMDRTVPAKQGRAADLLKRIDSEHTLVLSPQSLNQRNRRPHTKN